MKYNKVIFFGSKSIGLKCLKYLTSIAGVKVVGVVLCPVNQWNSEDKTELDELLIYYNISTIKRDEVLKCEAQLGVSVFYQEILKRDIINHFSGGIVNLHCAPLPYYRGYNPYSHAIINGEKQYGPTIHFIDEGVDTGPIIKINWFDIEKNDTSKDLFEKTRIAAFELFKEMIPKVLNGEVHTESQLSLIKKGAISRYYKQNSLKGLKQLYLSWPQKKLDRYIRALSFSPFEPPYVVINGQKIHFSVSREYSSVQEFRDVE